MRPMIETIHECCGACERFPVGDWPDISVKTAAGLVSKLRLDAPLGGYLVQQEKPNKGAVNHNNSLDALWTLRIGKFCRAEI